MGIWIKQRHYVTYARFIDELLN